MGRLPRAFLLACALLAGSCLRAQQPDTVVLRNDGEPVAIDSAVSDQTQTDGVIEEVVPDRSDDDTVYAIAQPFSTDSARVARRDVSPNGFNRARSDEDFWYWSYREKQKKAKTQKNTTPATSTDWKMPAPLFWTLIGAGILTLLYLLLKSMNVDPFARRTTLIGGDEDAETEEDIFNRNYEQEVATAIAAGNYRLAIRLRYLQLLRELSDRNIIQYRIGATNGIYVSQLWGTNYYQAFFRATRTFEYAWYGGLDVTHTAYERMQQDIAHLKTQFI